ncbi:MAG: HU family DNA-binding protein [bacterium]|jgi:DNA-binding protein HU-beta|uniref:HU family DNA-binding protein n=1 Tax=Candidatus Acididesulfobacter diazotrophicus TaxID=2597226 RepID=A0A519BL29_9DELT|nr:HU family DNA-binding protein [Deltaproteobacteria bacterium]RZD17982.1 MAG: HU family DNA-binding protein [Candidatus Acididesulfobacter diazotrophicus]
MTKAELVDAIAKSSKLTKADSEKALNATVESVVAALKKGDSVRLVGFGTFEVVKRAARKGRNPQTGKEIQIKASKSPKFKPGKTFKEAVNTGK